MTYATQTWNNKDAATPISADRMNHMEAGIQGEESRALAAEAALTTAIGTPLLPSTANAVNVVNSAATDWVEQLLVNANIDPAAAIAATKVKQPQSDYMHANPNLANLPIGAGAVAAAALTPTFYPIDPQGRTSIPVTSLHSQVKTAFAASTIGIAIYSAVYTGNKTGTFTRVSYLSTAASGASTGLVRADVDSGPITLDFTNNQYVIGSMVSDVSTLQLTNTSGAATQGAFKWTAAARSSTVDWPTSFTDASAASATPATAKLNWHALITTAGKNWF